MNLYELKNILEATGFPVAYSHFRKTENEALPAPPFIVYIITYSSHFMADNKVHKPIENAQIELYTNQKDLEAEAILEAVLNENEIPYSSSETWIDSEQLHQKIYEMRLI